MHGEYLVVGIGVHEVGLWSEQLEANYHGKQPADQEEEADADQIEKSNDDGLLLDGQDGGRGNCWTSSMICR